MQTRNSSLTISGASTTPQKPCVSPQLEISRRHDVNTLDAYAWALCGNGRYEEAKKQIAKALAVGVREASMFYHAGVIAAKLKDEASAAALFESVGGAQPNI